MLTGLKQIGVIGAIRFFFTTWLDLVYRLLPFPQLRVIYLRLCGAHIGKGTIICRGVRFLNLYRTGYRGLSIGNFCWIGEEAMFDLADKIDIGDHVTIGQRAMILTHLNVGYHAHPLQKHFPSHQKSVKIESGVFLGPYALVLAGVRIGKESFIMAQSLVSQNIRSGVYYSMQGKPRSVPTTFFSGDPDDSENT